MKYYAVVIKNGAICVSKDACISETRWVGKQCINHDDTVMYDIHKQAIATAMIDLEGKW